MTLRGSRSLQRRLKRMKRHFDEAPHRAAKRGLDTKTTTAAKGRIVENDAVASTTLFRSFRTTSKPIPNGHRVRLVNDAPHSAFVEFGTGEMHRPNPYTEPFEAPPLTTRLIRNIKTWAIMKPSFVPYRTYDDAANAIAHAIAYGSDERPSGTPPQPFFIPAWSATKHIVIEDIEAAVRFGV